MLLVLARVLPGFPNSASYIYIFFLEKNMSYKMVDKSTENDTPRLNIYVTSNPRVISH